MNHQSKAEIIEYRKEIELEITELLEDTESDITLDDIKEIIYNEEDNDDMQKVIALFDDGDVEHLSTILEIVTDAWNYFPHKLLDGLSPAERIFEYEQSKNG